MRRTGHRHVGLLALLALGAAGADAGGPGVSRATYLANAGVMIERGSVKIAFDPLFRNDYDRYELVPPEIEAALFAGDPPYDGIDAVFISHYHGDHFSPEVMLAFLEAHGDVELYAPEQAVAALLEAGAGEHVIDRVHGVEMAYGDPPIRLASGDLVIEAVRIPHAGWPNRMLEVENIAWRVTLDGESSVVHLGDADTGLAHFDLHERHWLGAGTDLALPPYWYFLSPNGRTVLDTRIDAGHDIGVHVPEEMPDDRGQRPAGLAAYDLFTVPGETREIRSRVTGEP